MEFAVRVPSYLYANATEGLCGVCAGYQEQLVTSYGTVTDDFELVKFTAPAKSLLRHFNLILTVLVS